MDFSSDDVLRLLIQYMQRASSFGVGGSGAVAGRDRPELAAAEEASVPPRRSPGVPRPLLGAEVDAVQAEAETVAEDVLEDVEERPHEVAMHVRSVQSQKLTRRLYGNRGVNIL